MDPRLGQLFDTLATSDGSPEVVERCGFLMAMIVERHSAQRSDEGFYREVLPEPYFSLSLADSEYTDLVTRMAGLLGRPDASADAIQSALFILGGTDSRTLQVTIPALVRSLNRENSQVSTAQIIRTLQTMISSPKSVESKASAILLQTKGLGGIDSAIRSLSESHETQGAAVVEKLRSLLVAGLDRVS